MANTSNKKKKKKKKRSILPGKGTRKEGDPFTLEEKKEYFKEKATNKKRESSLAKKGKIYQERKKGPEQQEGGREGRKGFSNSFKEKEGM